MGEEEKRKLDDDGLKEDDDFDDDNQKAREQEILYLPGGKEDFVSLINASNESNGWVRKYRDYDCYRKMLGPGKLHDVAARTKIGDYVGSCICLEFDEYAFVAIYYVGPEYRKRGIGTELFKQVVNNNLRKKNIGLHAVQVMSPIYDQKLGFSKRASWLVDSMAIKNVDTSKINVDDIKLTVKDAKELSLQQMVDYDAKVAKCRREGFVRYWAVDRIDAVCKVVVNSENEIVGYGCGRLQSIVGNPGFGPIYCDTDDGFKLLFRVLVLCFDEELKEKNLITFRSPTHKSGTVQKMLQEAANVEFKSQCVPQFTNVVPDHDIDKIYCITDMTMFI